jgi:type II secretory pathway pseudopilin PulG
MNRRGLTLIELVVAVGIFMALSVLIFGFFRYGTRTFMQVNARHGLQNAALRSLESIQYEMKRTNASSVTVINDATRRATVEGANVQRDLVCLAGLQKWHDRTNSNNYDLETGAPKWNRYWIFYTNLEAQGKLFRLRVDPAPPPEVPVRLPLADLDQLHHDDPGLNQYSGETPAYSTLAQKVKEFKIEGPSQTGGEFYSFSLLLKKKATAGSTEGAQRRPFDFYEVKLDVKPENTYP